MGNSLSLDKVENCEKEKPKRFSPYKSKTKDEDPSMKQTRRRHKSEGQALDKPNYEHIKPPKVTKKTKTKQELENQQPEIIDFERSNSSNCHEEISVNELASYLEFSTLIPRKMSSMAESIYG